MADGSALFLVDGYHPGRDQALVAALLAEGGLPVSVETRVGTIWVRSDGRPWLPPAPGATIRLEVPAWPRQPAPRRDTLETRIVAVMAAADGPVTVNAIWQALGCDDGPGSRRDISQRLSRMVQSGRVHERGLTPGLTPGRGRSMIKLFALPADAKGPPRRARPGQMRALRELAQQADGSALADTLAEALDLSTSTVGTLLRQLMAEGLVAREPLPGILRYIWTVTDAGRAALAAAEDGDRG